MAGNSVKPAGRIPDRQPLCPVPLAPLGDTRRGRGGHGLCDEIPLQEAHAPPGAQPEGGAMSRGGAGALGVGETAMVSSTAPPPGGTAATCATVAARCPMAT